eukprot:CAMPEP_0168164828 /NCGR_PEP_ID=MMETSP0139_2-20121125/1150_1 /TAXON_ID=44445 /ORGANISM="Pseudo-nitzschia australis, Strain 10249 10 AB" /LENGTH=150 /DNA_ID=CAMNT_0008081881 /DNA_START=411 /DNA_END=863 /DNA_ORIENTATION=+
MFSPVPPDICPPIPIPTASPTNLPVIGSILVAIIFWIGIACAIPSFSIDPWTFPTTLRDLFLTNALAVAKIFPRWVFAWSRLSIEIWRALLRNAWPTLRYAILCGTWLQTDFAMLLLRSKKRPPLALIMSKTSSMISCLKARSDLWYRSR